MDHTIEVLFGLSVVFVAARLGAELAQRLKLSAVVGEIAAESFNRCAGAGLGAGKRTFGGAGGNRRGAAHVLGGDGDSRQ